MCSSTVLSELTHILPTYYRAVRDAFLSNNCFGFRLASIQCTFYIDEAVSVNVMSQYLAPI